MRYREKQPEKEEIRKKRGRLEDNMKHETTKSEISLFENLIF